MLGQRRYLRLPCLDRFYWGLWLPGAIAGLGCGSEGALMFGQVWV
jgi:hypothetical protein